MDIFDAVASRYSCRAFLPTPVPEATVRDIVARASRAPSAGNMQPWRVYALAGKRVEELVALLAPRMATELPRGEGADYTIYPEPLNEPYKARRFEVGELLYQAINVPRGDKPARYRQYARNYQFFGAPVALFFAREKAHGPAQWADSSTAYFFLSVPRKVIFTAPASVSAAAPSTYSNRGAVILVAVVLPAVWLAAMADSPSAQCSAERLCKE